MLVVLSKWPMNQFKPVQQRRQQIIRAYCPNIYTVPGFMRKSIWTNSPTIQEIHHILMAISFCNVTCSFSFFGSQINGNYFQICQEFHHFDVTFYKSGLHFRMCFLFRSYIHPKSYIYKAKH